MLEAVSGYFYDPYVFWGAPLALAFAYAVWRRIRKRPPGRP